MFPCGPCPLVVLSVFKTAVDITSWILSVAPWYPSGTIHPGRDRHRDDVGEGMADGEKGARRGKGKRRQGRYSESPIPSATRQGE